MTRTIFALAILTTPAALPAQSSVGMEVSATVPMICRVENRVSAVDPGGTRTAIGSFDEMCNTDASYGLRFEHRNLEPGENATIFYDGISVEMGKDGYTLLGDHTGPVRKTHQIEATGTNLRSPIDLYIVMQQH